MPKYLTIIEANNFISNFAGMRGSAIYAEYITDLAIRGNHFASNGPVTTFAESVYSPYVKYFSGPDNPLSFNSQCADNEFSYLNDCQ